jgi:hypothetical protein
VPESDNLSLLHRVHHRVHHEGRIERVHVTIMLLPAVTIELVVKGDMNVIGHAIVKGRPYINGKAAKLDRPKRNKKLELLNGALSEWRCPECNARLSGDSMICLNLCHLSAASARRFNDGLAEADRRVRHRNAVKEKMKNESGVLVELTAEIADNSDFDLMDML